MRILTSGELPKGVRLPKDVVHHHIQPYLMIGARQGKIRYYGVLKEMRVKFREMRVQKRKKEESELARRRRREYHLDKIRRQYGWVRCKSCNFLKRNRTGYGMCVSCFNRDIVIKVIYEKVGSFEDNNDEMYDVITMVVDKTTGQVLSQNIRSEIVERGAIKFAN